MKRIGRKLVMICLVMLALCVSAGAVGSAFDRLDFIRREGFTTEIVDVYGEVYTYDGVLNVSTLEEHDCVEEVASYAILFEGEEVLTAQLHDIYAVPEGQSAGAAAATNGYYSVTFYIGDSSEKEVFMTGLTPENQKKVQDANIAAVLNGTSVSLDDLAFIDAEKQYVIRDEDGYMDSDQDLCWAAAASNVLHYTGWGKAAGFGSADYLLEHFAACFEDGGSRAEFGLDWFFNGYYRAQSWDVWPKVNARGRLAYGTFPGYFPQYCAGDLIELVNVDDRPWNIERAMTALREGCGVSIGLGWYNYNGVRNGGHAITLWGYVKDRYSSAVTDKSTYCALIISDSDNNITGGSDRRGAPDTLQVEPIQSVSLADMDTWCFSDYGWGDGYLEDFTILKPWSEDIPVDGNAKTEEALSVFSPWDIAITKVETGVSDMTADVFGRNQTIQLVPYITVRGDTDYTGPLALTLTVTNSAGTKVWESTEQIEGDTYAAGEIRYFIIDFENTLPAGTYTVTATISDMTADTYQNNNTASKTFTVSSYSTSTYDSLKISSAGMEKMEGYGMSGRLTLNYIGSLGFTPQQYLLDITYDGGENWETIYAGKTRPTVIENLYLGPDMVKSTYVRLFMQTLDTSGYSGLLTDKFEVSVADYYALAVYSDVHSLEVQEGGTTFSNSGKLQFNVVDCGSLSVQNDYLMTLIASSWDEDVTLLEDHYNPSRSGTVHTFSELSEMANLPAGEYDLYADFWYDPVVDGRYQSYSYEWLGTLTVLPSVTSEEHWSLTCYTPDVSATEVYLPYELQAPAGSTFDVKVCYRSASSTGEATYGRTYTDFLGGWEYEGFTLPVDPDTTYSYEMKILQGKTVVASTEAGTFTTPGFDGLTIGAEEETSFTLEREAQAVYALTAPSAGTYTISAKGPMGLLKVRDGDWKTYSQSFNGLGESLQVTMNAGETAYLFVTAEMGGEFTLSTKAAGIETETVLLTPEETALTLKSGGSVSCRTYTALDTDGTVTLTVAGADGYVRYYDDTQGVFVTRKFTLGGTQVTLPVTAGSSASFQVYAYEGGEYTLSYTSDVTLYSRTADGVGFLMGQNDSAVTLAALYRDDGKMLDVKAVTAGSGLRLQGGEGARVDFLTLSDSYLPEADVKELALASLQMEPS